MNPNIEIHEDIGIKHLKHPRVLIKYLNTMGNVYNNINNYNPTTIRKNLIVLDDMIADINTNKKFPGIFKDLFFRCRKLNICLIFSTLFYFSVPKEVRLNSTHYLIMKIYIRRELQYIAVNHSADIDYKDFMNI